ncbi:MAG: hypothetical protein AAB358_03600 [Patescibacteria group bacterium]
MITVLLIATVVGLVASDTGHEKARFVAICLICSTGAAAFLALCSDVAYRFYRRLVAINRYRQRNWGWVVGAMAIPAFILAGGESHDLTNNLIAGGIGIGCLALCWIINRLPSWHSGIHFRKQQGGM